ncbi:senescence/dehydration-associated protein At4g35985, chloroplastic-like [Macadamia integrifolia]|uniref:senescence/dehydration-associated protein At4g35985, chloroplastic-like n=1 Tax=Macadamia integrifolia TaxID=60698 RepID=UPI001C4FE99B|nr:senescence/dehydration-associated protein At4g35985, chloroplastic-like [Macadamia integrifolia]
MACFRSGHRRKNISSTSNNNYPDMAYSSKQKNPETRKRKEEVLLQIPRCTVHLMEEGDTAELTNGYFTLVRLTEDNFGLATIVRVGDDLQWPLTKDEPVVKLDSLHYLFSLPVKDGDPLSYGVSFSEQSRNELGALDSFLKEHSCFSSSPSSTKNGLLDWRDFAPKVDDYNNVLAKAIVESTGQIVKGIFGCTNAYTKKVQQGGEMILSQVGEKNSIPATGNKSNISAGKTKNGGIEKSLKRARKISKMTEKMSKSLLDGITVATGSVVEPLARTQAGKAFLGMVPGEVLLASLDAVNQVLDAVEIAERQALSATSVAATRMVTQRFGESAGEVTEDAFATAGHCAGTAWNVLKIRKAVTPGSSVPSAILRNAVKNRIK